MEKRLITCIACPVGCMLEVWRGPDGSVLVAKNVCARGLAYGAQEFSAPVRTVTSSVRVERGAEPLAAVRSASPIPKEKIGAALAEIRALKRAAPLAPGDVLFDDLAGTGVPLVVTRGVAIVS